MIRTKIDADDIRIGDRIDAGDVLEVRREGRRVAVRTNGAPRMVAFDQHAQVEVLVEDIR